MDLNKTEKILEFDKIKETWKAFALTDAAKERVSRMMPYLSEHQMERKYVDGEIYVE